MLSNEIRALFLKYFEDRGHTILPSSSLIPHGDPTLLFTTAGMVQIKPYFMGQATPPNQRLASCQKCFRTTDIESVGDNKHLTFFEMLGNFSVGDYFKKEAIEWAWEFVTGYLKLDPNKLWVTIFTDDDEAFSIWKHIGFPTSKIVRLGEKDNFWGPAGDSGPCGPCSEIHFDFGEKYGCGKSDCDPSCSCGRFSEIWNLVFTEYNQDKVGNRTKLPKPNIDTGMGLERIIAACNGSPTIYETDLFVPILDRVFQILSCSSTNKNKTEEIERSVKIIAEHSRGISFLIADGVLPSNEGRGYVLRRILRRACFMGRRSGINKPFMSDVAHVVIDKMGQIYPELVKNEKLIKNVIDTEEEKFYDTLDAGINMCERAIAEAKSQNRSYLKNDEVFKFWDTYGFPFELTSEIAHDHGIQVDRMGFEQEMMKQRERARAAHKFAGELTPAVALNYQQGQNIKFIGYDKLVSESNVVGIIDEHSVSKVDKAIEGQQAFLLINPSPFYGEMGGQVGDTGIIQSDGGVFKVSNSVYLPSGQLAVIGKVDKGQFEINDKVVAIVDENRRMDIARNHTATHILQSVLRKVLGSHVAQRGSLVAPDRLRFDFVHIGTISEEQLRNIQSEVNEIIRKNMHVVTEICSYNEAIEQGAIAIFEEKYGDVVRMVKIGTPQISIELCGGTHVRSTGEIGLFLITSESSIGTGLRRIEAITGRAAETYVADRLSILEILSNDLRCSVNELPAKLSNIIADLGNMSKQVNLLRRELNKYEAEKLINNIKTVKNTNYIVSKVSPMPSTSLMEMADILKNKVKSIVVILATIYENKPIFVAAATPDLVKKGVHSGKLVKMVAEKAGGGGGGRADIAQAGAKDTEKIDEALSFASEFIKEMIAG